MVLVASEIVDRYNVKYYGATGNGINDDTLSIQNAINAIGEYSTLIFPKGVYIISSTILLNKNIKLDGNRSIIKRISNIHIMEIDKTGSHNQIIDFVFDGNKSVVQQPMSVMFIRGTFNTIQNCVIKNSSDHGIGFDGQMSSSCKFNIVDNCTICDNDGIGLSNNLGSENKFINNTIFNNLKEGITLDNNADYNIVKGNRLYNNCINGGGVGSIGIDATNYCIISDNIISETNSKPGITTQNNIDKCEYNIITGNVISGISGDANNKGIELHAYSHSNYPQNKYSTNNLVSHNIVQNGISNESNDNSIKDNISPNLNVDVELYKLDNDIIKDISKLYVPIVEKSVVTSRFSTESLCTKVGIPKGMNIVLLKTYYMIDTTTFRLKVDSQNATEIEYSVDNDTYQNDEQINTKMGIKLLTIKLFYNNSRSHVFHTNDTIDVKINNANINVSNLSNIELKKPECFTSIKNWHSKVVTSAGTLKVPYYNRTRWEPIHDYYPRPTMKRDNWLNLNGTWKLSLDDNSSSIPPNLNFNDEINVPFCVESINSGVVQKSHDFWYKRDFVLGSEYANRRCMLNFGAVDYKCWVYVNNIYIGTYNEKNSEDPITYDNSHTGGYDSFSFEITDFVVVGNNVLHVRIHDPSHDSQIKGKQVNSPENIWYTTCSGIWQTCWIEHVSKANYIKNIFNKPTLSSIQFEITSKIDTFTTYKVKIEDKNKKLIYEGDYIQNSIINIDNPVNWSPNNPYLYTCTITQYTNGELTDTIHSYFGLRKVHVENGNLYLNNVNIYSFGALDQGYWPDGIYTAPNDDGLKYDIEFSKNVGYNTLRKHVKVEPSQWYYHCDVMGMLVQQDIPSARNANYGHQSNEMINIVKTLRNHPCIIMWVLYNERWGYNDSNANARMDILKNIDTIDLTCNISTTSYTGRLVNVESGKWGASTTLINKGHVFSRHHYPCCKRFSNNLEVEVDTWLKVNHHPDKVFMIDEYGGYKCDPPSFNVYGSWGYETLNTSAFINKYNSVANMLYSKFSKDSLNVSLQGVIYTQITDVENETNGVMYYNRTYKIDPNAIKFSMIDHQI